MEVLHAFSDARYNLYIYTLYVGAYLDFLYGSQNSYKDMYMFVYAHIM